MINCEGRIEENVTDQMGQQKESERGQVSHLCSSWGQKSSEMKCIVVEQIRFHRGSMVRGHRMSGNQVTTEAKYRSTGHVGNR